MKKIIFSFLILFISYIVYNTLTYSECLKKVKEIGIENKKCSKIGYKYPIEDFVKINESIIIGSSFDVPHLFLDLIYLTETNISNGQMVLLDLNTNKITELPIKNFPEKIPFHPHGIDLYKDEYIYIINHSFNYYGSNERIEVIKIEKNPISLTFIKGYILPKNFLGTLNSICAISDETIYFTTSNPFPMPNSNFQNSFFYKYRYKFGNIISVLFNWKNTGMYSYNKGKIKFIKETSGFLNNGITFIPEKKLLYIAQTIDKRFLVLKIGKNETNPQLVKIVKSDYAYDNLFYDKSKGIIYAGILGRLMDYVGLTEHYKKYGNINYKGYYGGYEEIDTNNNDKIKVIHMSKDKLKGISSGMTIGKKQVLSASIEDGFLICE